MIQKDLVIKMVLQDKSESSRTRQVAVFEHALIFFVKQGIKGSDGQKISKMDEPNLPLGVYIGQICIIFEQR